MNHVMRKPVLCHMRTTTMQISLRICSLIRAFVFRRCLDSIIAILSKSVISRHKRAGWRVAWSDAQKADFFHDAAHI